MLEREREREREGLQPLSLILLLTTSLHLTPAADEYFRETGCCESGKGKEGAQRVHEVCIVLLFTTLLLLLPLPLLLIHQYIPLLLIIMFIIIINYSANFVISYTFLDQAPNITHSSPP
jgi:hypothetical protein